MWRQGRRSSYWENSPGLEDWGAAETETETESELMDGLRRTIARCLGLGGILLATLVISAGLLAIFSAAGKVSRRW